MSYAVRLSVTISGCYTSDPSSFCHLTAKFAGPHWRQHWRQHVGGGSQGEVGRAAAPGPAAGLQQQAAIQTIAQLANLSTMCNLMPLTLLVLYKDHAALTVWCANSWCTAQNASHVLISGRAVWAGPGCKAARLSWAGRPLWAQKLKGRSGVSPTTSLTQLRFPSIKRVVGDRANPSIQSV